MLAELSTALAIAVPAAHAAQERVCTLVGCWSAVNVAFRDLPRIVERRATRMTACAAGRCLVDTDMRYGAWLEDPIAGPNPVRVVVVFRDARGNVLWRRERIATATARRPNGDDCPPTCWTIRVAVDGAYLRLR